MFNSFLHSATTCAIREDTMSTSEGIAEGGRLPCVSISDTQTWEKEKKYVVKTQFSVTWFPLTYFGLIMMEDILYIKSHMNEFQSPAHTEQCW